MSTNILLTLANKDINLLKLINQGGWLMYPLLLLSILTLSLVLFYLFILRKKHIVNMQFLHNIAIFLEKKEFNKALSLSKRYNDAMSVITYKILEFLLVNPTASVQTMEDIAATEGSLQINKIHRKINLLADIAAIAPMIGLLGTVIGMIKAFYQLAHQAADEKSQYLAKGVSEALITTASGLIIGIIATLFYALFKRRSQSGILELEKQTTYLLASIKQSTKNNL